MIQKIKTSLVWKIAALFLAASIIPYLAASLIFFHSSKNALQNEIVKGLESQTELMRDNLDARLFLLRGNAIAWAGLEVMKDTLTDDIDKRIAAAIEGLKKDYRLAGNIYVMNNNGRIIAATLPSAINKTVGGMRSVNVMSGAATELDLHVSDIDNTPVFSFAVPIRPAFLEKKTVGVLMLECSPDDLKEITFAGTLFFASIISRNGEIIAASSEEPFYDSHFLNSIRAQDREIYSPPGYIMAVTQSRGYYDFKGFGWKVAAAVAEEKALYPIRRIEQASLMIGIAGIAAIFGAVLFFASRTVRPLKTLSRAADYIARTKDMSAKIETYSDDEVGKLALAFNHMIDELRRHIDRIHQMEESMRMADRLSALGELSAGMAHEIKNPLGVIRSSADMLKERLENSKPNGALAAIISEESGRLARILESFLQFARPRPARKRECMVNDILKNSLALLEPDMRKANINVNINLDEGIPLIQADSDQLHQVFMNIAINALHAMLGGGTFGVTTVFHNRPSPPLSSIGSDVIEITFSDSGTGIPEEIRKKIFNPFFTTKEKGTGLGLAIAQGMIKEHGGMVEVEPGLPKGTVFRIYLPAGENK